MKKIIFLLFFAFAMNANALVITLSRTAPNNDGDYLHKIANVFADSIGNTLKAMYPAIIEPNSISVKISSDGKNITLAYSAVIVKVKNQEEAQFYFDHRGALSVSLNRDFALEDAKNRARTQMIPFVDKFTEAYGESNLYISHNNRSETILNGKTWVIFENFVATGIN